MKHHTVGPWRNEPKMLTTKDTYDTIKAVSSKLRAAIRVIDKWRPYRQGVNVNELLRLTRTATEALESINQERT